MAAHGVTCLLTGARPLPSYVDDDGAGNAAPPPPPRAPGRPPPPTTTVCAFCVQMPKEFPKAGYYATQYCVTKDAQGNVRFEMNSFKE